MASGCLIGVDRLISGRLIGVRLNVKCVLFCIGYVRIILNVAAFYFILHKPFLTTALHFTGGLLLDVADGVSARYLNQCKSMEM